MSSEEIKNEVNYLYGQINKAEEKIAEIRDLCPHENTQEGTYSYRVGSYLPSLICSDCGQVIKSLV